MHAHVEMLEFKIGDRVAFQADHRGLVEGMLTRYNRKTVTVIIDDGLLVVLILRFRCCGIRLKRITFLTERSDFLWSAWPTRFVAGSGLLFAAVTVVITVE
jgi:hypothetical protein